MKSKNYQLQVVIAAAGKGTRSGLDYPKCLYKVNNTPIIMRILNVTNHFDPEPHIIVSPDGKEKIEYYLDKNKLKYVPIIQRNPKGMGDAVSSTRKSKLLNSDNILLMWSDLPFVSYATINRLVKLHFSNKNDFTFVTSQTDSAYTKVLRDPNMKILEVIETRENKSFSISRGERDIGVFLFKRKKVLDLLEKDLSGKFGAVTGEHGFLYIIKHLVNLGSRVEALVIKNQLESVSFNSKADLKEYL